MTIWENPPLQSEQINMINLGRRHYYALCLKNRLLPESVSLKRYPDPQEMVET